MHTVTKLADLKNILWIYYWTLKDFIHTEFNCTQNDEVFHITQEEYAYIQKLAKKDDKKNELQEFIEEEIRQTFMQKDVYTLEQEIAEIDSILEANQKSLNHAKILYKDYKKIRHWDSIFNIWDICDIHIYDLLYKSKDGFWKIIMQRIGENDYKNISQEDKNLIDLLLSHIKTFIQSSNISPDGNIKDVLKVHEVRFHAYVREKM